MKAWEAVYNTFPVEEYNENPFIQALPLLADKKEIIRCLMNTVNIKEEEKMLDSSYRIHIVQRLYKVFQPLPIHVDIWNIMFTLLMQGYIARNPLDKDYKRHVNQQGKSIINRTYDISSRSSFRTTASCGTIIGISGMGKTTTVNRVLSNIPQIIIHNEYKNHHFSQIQLTWLKLEMPHNSSLKALCLQFFMKIDELLGTNNFRKHVSRNLSVDAMLPLMGQVAQNIGLGMLVIDEIQHLKSNGAEQIINFLVTLINSFGIPLVIIGTPASYRLFRDEFRIARRVTGNGEIIWNNMKKDDEFKLFLNSIWRYQWVKEYTPLSQELLDTIYEETQGISDLVVKLFVNVQADLLSNGDEKITTKAIKDAAKKHFSLMAPMISAIRSGNPYKMEQFEDIKAILNESANAPEASAKSSAKSCNTSKKAEIQNNGTDYIKKGKRVKENQGVKELEKGDLRLLIQKSEEKSNHEVLKAEGYVDELISWKEGEAYDEFCTQDI